MNFQKLASNMTQFKDPRTKCIRRAEPLTSPLYCRPIFIIAIFLSAAASIVDFLALQWLPSSTIGMFGSVSIIINLAVTRFILFERPNPKEWVPITLIIAGCMLAIAVTPDQNVASVPPKLVERTSSCVYIVGNWVVFILAALVLEHMDVPQWIDKIGFPFIGGALGAQNVCMGKYIAYALSTIQDGELQVRVDNLVAAVLLCAASIFVHIVWLNKGLEKHDAYYCIIVYQAAWFMFTTLSGVLVYDNISEEDTFTKCLFAAGVATAAYGVHKISVLHDTTQTEA
tara:strand:- start:1398 stop:2252 length:855 start_codon:yes stop_codon:yes gene_type:complete